MTNINSSVLVNLNTVKPEKVAVNNDNVVKSSSEKPSALTDKINISPQRTRTDANMKSLAAGIILGGIGVASIPLMAKAGVAVGLAGGIGASVLTAKALQAVDADFLSNKGLVVVGGAIGFNAVLAAMGKPVGETGPVYHFINVAAVSSTYTLPAVLLTK